MNIRLHHHIFHGRFMHIHTFFHRKIMCSCQLATCLYDMLQTSYECRFHHSRVASSVPIWATFYTYHRQDMPIVDSSRDEPPKPPCRFAPRDHNIYAHICRGKWWCCNPHTRTWENPGRFFRAELLYILYIAGKNVKNCKVRSRLCALDPSIFHFIWAKHGGKIW